MATFYIMEKKKTKNNPKYIGYQTAGMNFYCN